MSFTKHQLAGGLYTRPKEYCTCDRCGCTVPTDTCTPWEGPDGEQHVCKDKERCLRLKADVEAMRREF